MGAAFRFTSFFIAIDILSGRVIKIKQDPGQSLVVGYPMNDLLG